MWQPTPEICEEIVAHVQRGIDVSEICNYYQFSRLTVMRILRNASSSSIHGRRHRDSDEMNIQHDGTDTIANAAYALLRTIVARPEVPYSVWPRELLRVRFDELRQVCAVELGRTDDGLRDPLLMATLNARIHEIHCELVPELPTLTMWQEQNDSDSDSVSSFERPLKFAHANNESSSSISTPR
jgi:hypothetical protein